MPRLGIIIPALIALPILLSGPAPAEQNAAVADAVRIASGQNATIGLIAGGPGSTDARIAADIAKALNDSDQLARPADARARFGAKYR